MAVWRLQTNTAGGKIADYCIKNNVAALGWSLKEICQSDREQIGKDFKTYCKYAETQYSQFVSAKTLASKKIKCDDLIWMRNKGKYYIARVSEKSEWLFNASLDATEHDASNQLTEIVWHELKNEGDESCVPGAVSTSFIKGKTVQRIHKEGINDYSQFIYNEITNSNHYKIKLEATESKFYSLLTPNDCEDLLYFWLYKKYGYICVPSSNKVSTPLYEFVLLDPLTEKHIYIQVKKGDTVIDANDYASLDGDVYLLSTSGKILHIEDYKNMFEVNPTTLYEFAMNPNSRKVLSKSIKKWIECLTNN